MSLKTFFFSSGDLKINSSDLPVSAAENQTVILPCQTDPKVDVINETVEWEVHWENSARKIHVRGSNGTHTDKTDPRTSLFVDELSKGNISLNMTNVTKEDAGNYTCKIVVDSAVIGEGNVTLNVGECCCFSADINEKTLLSLYHAVT